jgi:hypothetical protein
MRFFLSAALAASMVAPATACVFDAYSVDQIRTFSVDLALYIDGQPTQQRFHLEQPFRVHYEALLDVASDGKAEVPQLRIRPQAMLASTESEAMFDDATRVVFLFTVPAAPAPWLPPPPPDPIGVFADYYRPELGGVVRTAHGFNLFGVDANTPDIQSVTQTASGWTTNVLGPFRDPEPIDWVTALGTKFFIPQEVTFDIAATNWGWTDATIPLTAPDCLCSGDHNADGAVDQADMDLVLLNWGMLPPPEWTHDPPEFVRQGSLDAVLIAWGDVSPAKLMGASAVPEPATCVILLIAAFFARVCTNVRD